MDERLFNPISTAELERRWAAARKEMAERKIDALVMQQNNDWLGGYRPLVHRHQPEQRLSAHRHLPGRRSDDRDRHGAVRRTSQARRRGRDQPRRRRDDLHARLHQRGLHRRISGRADGGRAQAARLPHRRMARQRRDAAQIRGAGRARTCGQRHVRRRDRVHRPHQGAQERGGDAAHPHGGGNAGRDLRPGVRENPPRHARQRHHRARAIRRAAARQRAGPVSRLVGAARAGVAFHRPPHAGPRAAPGRALQPADREQRPRRLLHRDRPHHRARQGIERTHRRVRIR